LFEFERIKCLVQDKVTDDVTDIANAPWKNNVNMGWNRHNKNEIQRFTMKAYASVAAATDGEVFDRLVDFLKGTL